MENTYGFNSAGDVDGINGGNSLERLAAANTAFWSNTELDRSIAENTQELALTNRQIIEAQAQLDALSRQVNTEPKTEAKLYQRDPRIEAKELRWKHRYHAVRAERDEYYARLLKISHGESVDNPAAPATIPVSEFAPKTYRTNMQVAEEIARERIASLPRVEIDFFKDYKRGEPESAVEEG